MERILTTKQIAQACGASLENCDEKIVLSLDGQRIYRVFENLISNALKYSLPNSRVYVTLSQDEK